MVDPTRSYPVPHVADSEHDKIDQPVGPLANDPSRPSNLTLHRAHPVFTGQKAEDRPASDSDVNAPRLRHRPMNASSAKAACYRPNRV